MSYSSQKKRVESAFTWAQKRMHTSFHFTFHALRSKEDGRQEGVVCVITDTARGSDDPEFFRVGYNPDVTRKMTASNLRKIAVHETIHAILWPLAAYAQEAAEDEVGENRVREIDEAITYKLQRAIVGDLT